MSCRIEKALRIKINGVCSCGWSILSFSPIEYESLRRPTTRTEEYHEITVKNKRILLKL